MRRLILLFLTLCLACSLFGCTKGRGAASSSDLTQKQIGEFFGKTHSNVNYSINQAKENMAKNPQAKVIAIGAIGEFQNKN